MFLKRGKKGMLVECILNKKFEKGVDIWRRVESVFDNDFKIHF